MTDETCRYCDGTGEFYGNMNIACDCENGTRFVERTDRQNVILEDFDLQIRMARRSLIQRFYATARAQLRGALLAIDQLEGRQEP